MKFRFNFMRGDTILSDKPYSSREEKRILDALGRGLLREFPNPERIGCPSSEIVRGIARHRVPLVEAEPWLDHLTSCSPCYRDFSQFRDAYQFRRMTILFAIVASLLVIASAAGWSLVRKYRQRDLDQTAVLDLRDRSVPRGTESRSNPSQGERPLELRRTVSHLNIYLPLGSSDGPYDVRVVSPNGESLVTASGTAGLKDHITLLPIEVSLSSLRPGRYALQVRKDGLEWDSYPLVVR